MGVRGKRRVAYAPAVTGMAELPEKGLRALCGFEQPNGRVCARTAYDTSGKCYHHSPLTAERRRKYASRGGHTGGPGRRNLRAARREIGELKKAVARLARLTAAGRAEAYLRYRVDDVRDTIALVKGYIRLSELQIELGMNEDEARKDAAERLTADELLDTLGNTPDEGDSRPL